MMDFHHIMMLIHHKLYDSYKLYYCRKGKFALFRNFYRRFWVQLRVLGDAETAETDSQTDRQLGRQETQTSEVREGEVLVRMWF